MNGSVKSKRDRPDDGDADRGEDRTGGLHVHPEQPAAGPHAKPELTNPESTPGAGLLPDPNDPSDSPDSASS